MTFLSRFARLVRKHLPELVCFFKLINEVVDLLNKVVNYACQIPKFSIFFPEQAR
jgi:hypothetical protein